MTYKQFFSRVKSNNWTAEQLRCDVPPSDDLLEFMEEVGHRYESYVVRFCTLASA